MFVAGIKIFFGFVAGAILLVVGLAVLSGLWSLLIVILKTCAGGLTNLGKWAQWRAGWIVGFSIYCVIGCTLVEVADNRYFLAGSVMLLALLPAWAVKMFLLDRQRQRRLRDESSA